jgi:hypothetical protein
MILCLFNCLAAVAEQKYISENKPKINQKQMYCGLHFQFLGLIIITPEIFCITKDPPPVELCWLNDKYP